MDRLNNHSILFFTLLGAVTLLFLYLLKPFFFPIFWAVVIAGIFRPLYRWVERRLNRPNLSTLVVFAVIALIILLPAGMVGKLVFNESVQLYEKLSPDTKAIDKGFQKITGAIADNPIVHRLNINRRTLNEKIAEVIRSVTNYLFTHLAALTQNTLGMLVKLSIMLYALFFFIRDGERFLGAAMRILPLGMGRERLLYERFLITARSTLKVTLIIGGIQGAIGGILFFITGIEGAMIWGILMILTAVIPVVGCSIVWAPAGLLMLLTGHVWEGILILAAGVLVISMVDNLLRPVLIGKDVEMHPLLIFFSTLGGIALFGFSGFVIGPIVTSLLIAIWQMYDEFYRKDLAQG
ncbi:MAG: AI-2E family transporter [Deltaproteobacteria bacterium]|nr:AI-2E family transporter [Deltaproteobacteria bacterium]